MIFNPVYGGSSAPNLGSKTITANGTYLASADNLDGYDEVTANVSNTYVASDEGKVVSSGALVAQTSRTVTANDTYDTTMNDEVIVNVQPTLQAKTNLSITANGSFSYTPDSGYDGLSEVSGTVNVPSSSPTLITKTITANGTYDASSDNADGYSSVTVNISGGGGLPLGIGVGSYVLANIGLSWTSSAEENV